MRPSLVQYRPLDFVSPFCLICSDPGVGACIFYIHCRRRVLTRGYLSFSQTNPLENNCRMCRGTNLILLHASVASVLILEFAPYSASVSSLNATAVCPAVRALRETRSLVAFIPPLQRRKCTSAVLFFEPHSYPHPPPTTPIALFSPPIRDSTLAYNLYVRASMREVLTGGRHDLFRLILKQGCTIDS